jgi:hypothetical protein
VKLPTLIVHYRSVGPNSIEILDQRLVSFCSSDVQRRLSLTLQTEMFISYKFYFYDSYAGGAGKLSQSDYLQAW